MNISGDRTDGDDSLTISQNVTSRSGYVNAVAIDVEDWEHPLTVTDCDIIINMDSSTLDSSDSSNSSGFQMTGIRNLAIFDGTASLDIDISSLKDATGINSGLKANTSGSIDIKVGTANTDKSNLLGVSGLDTDGSGAINIEAEGGRSIIDYLEVEADAGNITFKGEISIKENRMGGGGGHYLDIPGSKKIVMLGSEGAEVSGACGFVYKKISNSKEGYYLTDESNQTVKKGIIKTVAGNSLTFMDSHEIDLEGLEVGKAYYGKYIGGLVSGGTKSYTFSLDESTSLPAGLSLGNTSGITCCITGTPTAVCEAGTFKIIVTDNSNPKQTKTIEVAYEAITVPKPVLSVSLDKSEIPLNQGESASIEATVSPDDATITDVTWNSDNTSVASVTAGTESGSKTSATVYANQNYAGKATVTVTTTEGNKTAKCDVYVKEKQPNATVNYSAGQLEGLIAGRSYKVSVPGEGEGITTTFTPEGTTYPIAAAWHGKTIELVRTNTEPKCDSAAQVITLAAKPMTPTKPTINGTPSTDSITINTVVGNSYRCYKAGTTPGDTWIKATGTTYTFSGLDSNTEYKIETKVTATETAPESDVSEALEVKTDKETVSAPTASRASGTYTSAFTLKISTTEDKATVYYEKGTSESATPAPTNSSNAFPDGGISIGASAADGDVTVIKVIVYKDDDSKKPSSVVTYTYTYAENKSVSVSGNVVSKDNVNNAVVKLYAGTEKDADIRADMRKTAPEKALGHAFTLGSETGSKQSLTLSAELADGTYKLAVYKPKKDGKDPYVVSVVKVTVSSGIATIDGGSDVKMWLYGDVNDDGSVNSTDATFIMRYEVGMASCITGDDGTIRGAHQSVVADVNGDGMINSTDSTVIMRYEVGTPMYVFK